MNYYRLSIVNDSIEKVHQTLQISKQFELKTILISGADMLSIVNDQIVHASVKKNSERMNVGVLSIVSNSIENEL